MAGYTVRRRAAPYRQPPVVRRAHDGATRPPGAAGGWRGRYPQRQVRPRPGRFAAPEPGHPARLPHEQGYLAVRFAGRHGRARHGAGPARNELPPHRPGSPAPETQTRRGPGRVGCARQPGLFRCRRRLCGRPGAAVEADRPRGGGGHRLPVHGRAGGGHALPLPRAGGGHPAGTRRPGAHPPRHAPAAAAYLCPGCVPDAQTAGAGLTAVRSQRHVPPRLARALAEAAEC